MSIAFRGSPDESPAARREDIERIRRSIGDAEAQSGRPAPVPRDGEERLRRLIAQRQARLAAVEFRREHAARDLHRLEEEARALAGEIAGYETGLRALLGRVLEEAAEWAAPHWSPVPVLGYRMWKVRDGALHGARTAWDGPAMEARCIGAGGREGDPRGVPHTAAECAHPPCGIYALKSFGGMLAGIHLPGRALGLVSLSGKVVEHERGYRAQYARVVALALGPRRIGPLRVGSGVDRGGLRRMRTGGGSRRHRRIESPADHRTARVLPESEREVPGEMDIGEPKRVIQVEPEPIRVPEEPVDPPTGPQTEPVPDREPERVPAR